MTRGARIVALVLAAALALGGVALHAVARAGWGLFVLAAMVLLGTLFDAGYRGRNRAVRGQWQLTGEREVDHETGAIMEVWYDPLSGERRYQPAGQRPD